MRDVIPTMPRRCSRRACLGVLGGAALTGFSLACGVTGGGAPPPAPAKDPAAKPTMGSGLALAVANSELVVGPNRFAMGVLEDGRSVQNATVLFEFFQVEGQNATKRAEAEATFLALDNPARGIYVARVAFDRPGPWGVQVSAARAGRPTLSGRSTFEVRAQSVAPMPGARAIPSRNPTAREVANLADLCSGQPPCDMHELSVQEALASGRPALLAFVTPGFCASATCAPVLGEIAKIKARRAAQVSFAHVEIYKDPRNLVVADAVREWNLMTEPWVFIVDRQGIIVDRFESLTTADELDASLAAIVDRLS